jgi:hypothetical protein
MRLWFPYNARIHIARSQNKWLLKTLLSPQKESYVPYNFRWSKILQQYARERDRKGSRLKGGRIWARRKYD